MIQMMRYLEVPLLTAMRTTSSSKLMTRCLKRRNEYLLKTRQFRLSNAAYVYLFIQEVRLYATAERQEIDAGSSDVFANLPWPDADTVFSMETGPTEKLRLDQTPMAQIGF